MKSVSTSVLSSISSVFSNTLTSPLLTSTSGGCGCSAPLLSISWSASVVFPIPNFFVSHLVVNGKFLYSFIMCVIISLVNGLLVGFWIGSENMFPRSASSTIPPPVVANGSIAITCPFFSVVLSPLS